MPGFFRRILKRWAKKPQPPKQRSAPGEDFTEVPLLEGGVATVKRPYATEQRPKEITDVVRPGAVAGAAKKKPGEKKE